MATTPNRFHITVRYRFIYEFINERTNRLHTLILKLIHRMHLPVKLYLIDH